MGFFSRLNDGMGLDLLSEAKRSEAAFFFSLSLSLSLLGCGLHLRESWGGAGKLHCWGGVFFVFVVGLSLLPLSFL